MKKHARDIFSSKWISSERPRTYHVLIKEKCEREKIVDSLHLSSVFTAELAVENEALLHVKAHEIGSHSEMDSKHPGLLTKKSPVDLEHLTFGKRYQTCLGSFYYWCLLERYNWFSTRIKNVGCLDQEFHTRSIRRSNLLSKNRYTSSPCFLLRSLLVLNHPRAYISKISILWFNHIFWIALSFPLQILTVATWSTTSIISSSLVLCCLALKPNLPLPLIHPLFLKIT